MTLGSGQVMSVPAGVPASMSASPIAVVHEPWPGVHNERVRGVDWLFRDRVHGGITIAQFPNWPLGVWMLTMAMRLIAHPRGTVGTAVEVVGTAALVIWAVDEIVRGVNPWRRILGAVVLAATIFGVTKRLAD